MKIGKKVEQVWWTLVSEFFQQFDNLHRAFKNVILSAHTYLILPWDGNTACSKFGVEVIVSLVQIDSLDCGELLDIQNILTVHCPGLGEGSDRHDKGWKKRGEEQTSLSQQLIYNHGNVIAFLQHTSFLQKQI